MADEQQDDYTFTKFSQSAFYGPVNAAFLDLVEVTPGQRIVDLACGTGGVTRQIAERLEGARSSVIIGIDQSTTALKQAVEEVKGVCGSAVHFVQSRVEQVHEAVKESVDTVIFCNAIHYIPDKGSLMGEVSRTLKPGGAFAFNTSFFKGPDMPEAVTFYRKWMLKAGRTLRRDYGLSPDSSQKVESRRHLAPEDYRSLLEANQFRIVKQRIRTVRVPQTAWLDISEFEDFIAGAMPGVPLDKASAALKKGVRQTFEELKIETVPRHWLEIVAVRV
jgi:ubiquinone/menaquinone biosynthesis C-methylase UbiE